jgi:hypothetical protein
VTVDHDATATYLLDAMGNRRECPSGGRTTVQAGYYPTTLVLRGATTVTLQPEG